MASINKAISIFEYGDPTKDPTKGLRSAINYRYLLLHVPINLIGYLCESPDHALQARHSYLLKLLHTKPTNLLSAVIDRKVPVPEKGQVRVRITLRPVNPADIFGMCGTHPSFKPDALPGVPGIEGVLTLGCYTLQRRRNLWQQQNCADPSIMRTISQQAQFTITSLPLPRGKQIQQSVASSG